MDDRLVIRAQEGDERAFASITAEIYARFNDVAYRILRDPHLAEDATQQAMVAIWRHLPSLRDPARFEAWAYRTLVRQCYGEVRKRRFVLELDLAPEPIARDELGAVADRDLLERAFLKLSVDHRAVVVLRYYAGMSMEQVAEALDIPIGTATSRLSRAMSKLRDALEADTVLFGSMGQEVAR